MSGGSFGWVLLKQNQKTPHAGSSSENLGNLAKFSLQQTWNAYVASTVSNSATPWTVDQQTPLPMRFSRQEYQSGLPLPPPGDHLDPGIKPVSLVSPALAGMWPSAVAVPGFSCSAACRIFPDQGSNPYLLHWQADSYPLYHQGSLSFIFKKEKNGSLKAKTCSSLHSYEVHITMKPRF